MKRRHVVAFLTVAILLLVGSWAWPGELVLPGVARTPGLNGSLWRSDLVLVAKAGPAEADVTAKFYDRDGRVLVWAGRLAPFTTFGEWPDILGLLWPGEEYLSGTLVVESPTAELDGYAYTYSEGTTGPVGQAVVGVDLAPCAVYLIPDGSDATRVNVQAFAATDGDWGLLAVDGVEYSLAPGETLQLLDLPSTIAGNHALVANCPHTGLPGETATVWIVPSEVSDQSNDSHELVPLGGG